MTRSRSARFASSSRFALLTLLAGCPDGEDLRFGASSALDLGRCSGVSCTASNDTATLTPASPKTCSEPARATLETAFSISLSDRLCGPGSGCAQSQAIAVGSDDSLWVLASAYPSDANDAMLWLGHFDRAGVELGAAIIAHWPSLDGGGTRYESNLAVAANGEATVFVYAVTTGPNADSYVRERAWVQTYQSNALPSGSAVSVDLASAHVAFGPDGKLLVAGNARDNRPHGVLSKLEGSEVVWSQTSILTAGHSDHGVMGLTLDGNGASTMLTVQRWDQNRDRQSFGLLRHDASGNLLWQRTLPETLGGNVGALAADARGNVVLRVTDGLGNSSPDFGVLHGIDGAGTLRFTYLIPNGGNRRAVAIEPRSGRVYAVAGPGPSPAAIHELSPDGGSCRSLATSLNTFTIDQLQVSSDAIYFRDSDSVGKLLLLNTP